jgi:hypothetical protein
MKKLNELIYDQKQLVKYMKEAKTRMDKLFYKEQIDIIEELIENMRKELNLK